MISSHVVSGRKPPNRVDFDFLGQPSDFRDSLAG